MPFPFYNTSFPSPSTKNSITNTAKDLGYRDFLLNKNLLPQYPFLSTSTNGGPRIGEPVLDTSINGNANVIPFGLPLETEGLLRYEIAILPNQFKNDDPTSPSLFNIEYIQKSQGIFGNVDFPQGIQSYPTTANQEITQYGLFGKTAYAEFRKNATLFNLYVDTTKQIDMADFISLQPAGFSQQLDSYLDVFGGLNGGGNAGIQAANVIGSVLDGNGLGLAKGGIVTNYDIRASLVGRVLGLTGVINDTKLGIIGGQQLALALGNNAAFNIQEEILGGLNVSENILSLVKTGNLSGFRPNYTITVPGNTGGRIADFTSRVLGFQVPISYLSKDGSIFQSESGEVDNITRTNAMLQNTGKGQVKSLISNIFSNLNGTTENDKPSNTAFRSGYAPGYKNNLGQATDIIPNIYAFYNADKATIYPFVVTNKNDVIPEISYNREQMVSNYGFESPNEKIAGVQGTNLTYNTRKISDVGFTWGSTEGSAINSVDNYSPLESLTEEGKKSLLVKTQKLFNSKGMFNIVSVEGSMGFNSTQTQTANAGGISRGSAVLSKNLYNNFFQTSPAGNDKNNTYCRSWTTLNRYDSVNKLIRHSSVLNSAKSLGSDYFRNTTELYNSTLDDNGFVKIAPYYEKDSSTNVKRYMFSIENLAWLDNTNNIPDVEKGYGDLTSGRKGRIMWFPPYNISINETTNVDWESTKFIGRGEPVYTYNNTERSASLSFSVIVDHSTYVNSFKGSTGPDDNYVASFMAGCVDIDSELAKRLTVSELSSLFSELTPQQSQTLLNPNISPIKFSVYYPNDVFTIDYITTKGYENGLNNDFATGGSTLGTIPVDPPGDGYGSGIIQGQLTNTNTSYNDTLNFGLNGDSYTILIDGVEINGIYSAFTSQNTLFENTLKTYMNGKCKYCVIKIKSTASPQGNSEANTNLADSRSDTMSKYFNNIGIPKNRIKIENNFIDTSSGCNNSLNTDSESCKKARRSDISIEYDTSLAINETVKPKSKTLNNLNLNNKITNRFYDESLYFQKLADDDRFIFDRFRDKIKFFHPAFHSTTPEGLNSRLTFLQQCTRQGPTIEAQNTVNLAFGRPPICILRLGDFFHTKILIDSLTIDYEPLIWDLNPEGIGVQPMLANVTLSIKIIGGSSLISPINKLQNALSFNYYANTRTYDTRADYFTNDGVLTSGTTFIANSDTTSLRIKTLTTEDNQTTQNEENTPNVNNTESQAPPSTGTTEAKVTGIGKIDVGNWGGIKHDIRVNLTFEGINTSSSEEEQKTFLNKGLKLSIENNLGQLITEEVVTLNTPKYKSLNWLLSGGFDSPFGFYFGEILENDSDFTKILISSGSYVLKVKYNGELLFKKMFIVT